MYDYDISIQLKLVATIFNSSLKYAKEEEVVDLLRRRAQPLLEILGVMQYIR
jgi:hypothetical protein